jgi:hypothetical protein
MPAFAYFGTAAFAIRLLRLDQKIGSGVSMSLKRVANILNTDAMLLQQFCDRLSKYGDRTLVLFAGGRGARGRLIHFSFSSGLSCKTALSSELFTSICPL